MKKKLLISCFLLIAIFSTKLNSQERNKNLEQGKQALFYGKSQESIVLFEKALEHYQKEKDHSKIAESHNLLSEAYRFLFQIEKAMFHANRALKISRGEALDKRQEANALDNTAQIYAIMRQLDVALSDHEEALRIRTDYFPKDSLSRAISFYHIGGILTGKSQYKKALDYFEKAIKISPNNTPENQIFLANIDIAISHIYYDQSKFDEALVYLEKSLQKSGQIFDKENPYYAEIYNKLGVIYSMKEQLHESLNYYKKALSVNIKTYGLDKHPGQAKIHYNIGTIYQKQGFKEKALYHTEKTLEMGINAFGEKHKNLAFPYSQLGQIYGDEKGIPYIEKAIEILDQPGGNPIQISYLHDYLAKIYSDVENHIKALKHAKKSLTIRQNFFGEKSLNSIRSYNLISSIHANMKEYDTALLYNQKAIESNELQKIDEDLLLESIKTKADIYYKLYHQSNKKEYIQQSVNLYKRTISFINSARERKRNYDDKIQFSETVKSVFAKNIETTLLLDKLEKKNSFETIFHYSERSKANLLRELIRNTEAKASSNIPKVVLDAESYINTQVARLNSEILKEITYQERDSEKVYQLEGKLLDMARSKDSLEKTIETNFPLYHKLKYESKTILVSEVQEKLNEDTTLIEFFKSNDILYAFTISKDSFYVKELFITDLDEKIQELNTSIIHKNQSVFSAKSFELYQLLFKPLEEFIVGENLIIIPDESLWHLQFELLMTQENKKTSYLLYDYAISYGNSATLFFDDLKNNSRREVKDECIAFSYSNDKSVNSSNTVSLKKLRSSQIDLPGTRKEILEISKLYDGTYFYGNDANETNFKENGNQYKLVHLALHGEIDHVNPKNSKIYFTDSKEGNLEDNTLYGHELYALNIPADLVVLSACNTGSGQVNKGEGILSLGNAFQYAGAKSLVLSRWEISDKTTPVIIKSFYENLATGMNKSKALQKAKIQFLENSDAFESAPFHWGSFYLLGDAAPINIETSSTNDLFILLSAIGVLILIILVRRFLLQKKML